MNLTFVLALGDDMRALFSSTEAVFFLSVILIVIGAYIAITVADLYRRVGAYMRTVHAIFTVIFTQEGLETIKRAHNQLEQIKSSLASVDETRRQAKSLIREATKPEGEK